MKPFDETLQEFGIENFKVDLAIENGDIAVNDFGDLLLNNKEVDSIYRFLSKWRRQTATLESLFELWKSNRQERITLEQVKSINSIKDHIFREEEVASYREAEAAIAGAIFVLLSTLIKTPTVKLSRDSEVTFNGIPIDKIIQSAANNFRHYDEWSNIKKQYTDKQLKSVKILETALNLQVDGNSKSIISNICSDLLFAIANYELKNLNKLIHGFTKELWDSIKVKN
ncbi:hypothetical protein [Pantoea endophytica]|uniref:hypothetical protein n=1 Tax=Pantoea endophytica TaxID=92488 RepID=UPI00289769F8|nr:hypothetical protein [Pantoea endophytica]